MNNEILVKMTQEQFDIAINAIEKTRKEEERKMFVKIGNKMLQNLMSFCKENHLSIRADSYEGKYLPVITNLNHNLIIK